MPTTRAGVKRQRMERAPSEEEYQVLPALQADNPERRQRLLHILALFDPTKAVPDDLQRRVEDGPANGIENVDDFIPSYYADLCRVIIQAGEGDDNFYLRIIKVAHESFCALDVIRKKIDIAFRISEQSPVEELEAASDELDRKLRDCVLQILTVWGRPQTPKSAGIYVVATQLYIFDRVIAGHNQNNPQCEIHRDLLLSIVKELATFPEDVLPANLTAINHIIEALYTHDELYPGMNHTTQHELAGGLKKVIRYTAG